MDQFFSVLIGLFVLLSGIDIVGFAYTSIQRGVISDTNLDSDDGDDDGDGDEAVPVPSIVGCCYLPVVSFNGLACYVASYNYTIDGMYDEKIIHCSSYSSF